MSHRETPTVRLPRAKIAAVANEIYSPDPRTAHGVSNIDPSRRPTLPAGFGAALPTPPQAAPSEPAAEPPPPPFAKAALSKAATRAARLPDGYGFAELIHEGQWCDVWRAHDEAGHRVAVKVARSRTADVTARFAAEARALASLTHRSIVRLRAHGDTPDGRPFIALEWHEGPTMARAIEDRRAGLPPADAIRLLVPIANALLLAHDRGVVHGDVRAEHVLLSPLQGDRLLPVLIDFGASRRSRPDSQPPSPNEPSHPAPNPPGPVGDPATDVRAFAALVFHAIMGRPPFDTGARRAVEPPAGVPRSGLSERDAALWRILAEGLAPIGTKGAPSLHDLAKALARWADLRGVEADVTGSSILPRWTGSPTPSDRRGPPRGGESP